MILLKLAVSKLDQLQNNSSILDIGILVAMDFEKLSNMSIKCILKLHLGSIK